MIEKLYKHAVNRGRRAAGLTTALLLGVSGLALVPAALSAPAMAADCTLTAILENPCRPLIGAASNSYVGTGLKAAIENHEARAGRKMDVVHDYFGPGAVLDAEHKAMATRADTIAMYNYKPASSWSNGTGGNANANAGIDAMANSIKSLGSTKIFLTIAHEPENDIVPGGDPNCPNTQLNGRSGTTAQYVAMWHNVRERFDALGVDNVVWVANFLGYVNYQCTIRGLWPGNAYVDWVMWDPYPGAKSYTTVIGGFYSFLTGTSDATHNYLSKPWGLAEYGYVGSSQTAAYKFYDDIRATAKNGTFPKLRAYFNWDGKARHDNRVQYSASGVKDQVEQDHYNTLVNDPFFRDPVSNDNTPPTVQIDTPTDAATVTGTVSVAGPTGDNVAVTSCSLLVDGNVTGSAAPSGGRCSLPWNTASVANGNHTLALRALDAAGNSGGSGTITVAVGNPLDIDPPPVPTNLSATTGTSGGAPFVRLNWSANLSNPDLAGFRINRDDTRVDTVGKVATWTDTEVTAGSTYSYRVRSYDAAGNLSDFSNTVTVTVPTGGGPDTTPPSSPRPITATAGAAGTRSISVSWATSTDNVAVQWYWLYRGNAKYQRLPSTTTSYVDTGLTAGQRYTYKVYAIDTSNNWSGSSGNVSATAR